MNMLGGVLDDIDVIARHFDGDQTAEGVSPPVPKPPVKKAVKKTKTPPKMESVPVQVFEPPEEGKKAVKPKGSKSNAREQMHKDIEAK